MYSPTTKMERVASRVMLTAFVLWQCGAILHLVLDTHVILADGSVADLDRRTGEPIRESNGDNPTDNGCPILNQLTTASAVTSQDVVAMAFDHVVERPVEAKTDIYIVHEDNLFLIAPSHSPPTHS